MESEEQNITLYEFYNIISNYSQQLYTKYLSKIPNNVTPEEKVMFNGIEQAVNRAAERFRSLNYLMEADSVPGISNR